MHAWETVNGNDPHVATVEGAGYVGGQRSLLLAPAMALEVQPKDIDRMADILNGNGPRP